MEKVKDKGIHFTAGKITEAMQKQNPGFYADVQKIVSSTSVVKSDFRTSLLQVLKQAGKQNEIKNSVYHWVRQNSNHDTINGYPIKEPLAYLRKAQMGWEKRIYKSLNTMCTELGTSLAKARTRADREELEEKWGELGLYEVDLSLYRPVYAPKDFLEVLLSVRSPNLRSADCEGTWDLTQMPLKVKSMAELKSLYAEISRGEAFLGVNPNMNASIPGHSTLEAERTSMGVKVLAANHAPMAQEYLKRGCPRSLRGKVWALVLGATHSKENENNINELKQLVLHHDLLVDKLILKDIHLTASNDDQFFVFEDILYQTMLLFSRDTEVLSVFNQSPANPIHAVLKNKPALITNTVVFPPSGVIPFHGFTMYATPLCYLYNDVVDMYHTFRALYCRYYFRLHEVSSHQQGILCLCLLYERLMQKHEPQLWYHLKRIVKQPIRPVFKWLMRAFSGHLPPEQLLLLWDVIISYDSLEVLPLLAVTIMSFRRENLLSVDNQQNIDAVLADLSSISVLPLLQYALLRD